MTVTSSLEIEIKSWLRKVLKQDNVKDLSVSILGNSEKGDGYIGDIVFVTASASIDDGSIKEYNLVLKCSKRSQALRNSSPVKEAFLNEIFIYDKLLPIYRQFQRDKGIGNPFNSVPKYYGYFTEDNMEVIVFENLKKNGYELWPKKQPLTRQHIDIVVKEYAKFHATSVAMQVEEPAKFQNLVSGLKDIFKTFVETSGMETLFRSSMEESYELLNGELDESVMQRWKHFGTQINFVLNDLVINHDGLKVILHGDCWNNNFMYLTNDDCQKVPIEVAILDWQVARYSSPVLDLSYFLFTCISTEDLENLDDILTSYHQSFTNYLKKLGVTNPTTLYSLKKFLNDWKIYSQYGILMTSVLMKVCSTEKDEVVDIAQAAEDGKDFMHNFLNEIRDTDNFKNRMRPIIEYVVKHNLI